MSYPQAPISTCPPLPNITLPDGFTGQDVFVQTFFEGPPTCKCCKNWVESEPAEAPPEVKQKYVGTAIIKYKCKDHTSTTVGGLRQYKIQWMDILSPLIRKEIKPLLASLGYDFPNDAMTLHAPFQALYFGQARISDRFARLEEGCDDKQHLKLLIDVMKDLFVDLAPRVNDLLGKGKIDAAHLWVLFPKGQIVHSRHLGHVQAFQVRSLKDWNLYCRYVAYDGAAFGWTYTNIRIHEFVGTRSANELEAYPIGFHPRHEELKEELIERGRKSLDYQGISFSDYEGPAEGRIVRVYDEEEEEDYGPETQHIKATGRVVVDAFRGADYVSPMGSLGTLTPGASEETKLPCPQGRRSTPEEQDIYRSRIGVNRLWLMLMSPKTVAYHLKEKVWVSVSVEGLSPTSWEDDAFEQLVLPKSTKDLVLTFVESHKTTQALGSDFVAGKVSDKVKRPLYHLQAGEMGSKPSSLKSSLQKAFRLCEEWDGVLLLDVLLATLEYYSGIIFMTTNILEGLDPAIVSRLDIHLEYSCLDFPTRLQLWRNLLPPPPSTPQPSPSGTDDSSATLPAPAATVPDQHHSLTEDDFLDLASWKVNGRDIKHAVKNAWRWCFIKGKPVTLEALQTGLITTAPGSKREADVEDDGFNGGKRRRIE
ncbi:hypothetical protein PG993_007053 [Apiospora rasikravindrae]|uniref:DUF7025 domain-containing protein n=1 Tax=Apiospora rasikravindrae TaxID=990691 RepID=A0ABR1SWF7_9PEZI